MYKIKFNKYYVYVYLNPLKRGRYTYPNINVSFLFEPFYIGKGINDRMFVHIRSSLCHGWWKNTFLREINNLINNKTYPIIFKLIDNLSEEISFKKEIFYIKNIGRKDRQTGPLLNRTSGGEGVINYSFTKEHLDKLSKRMSGSNNIASKKNMSADMLIKKAKKAAMTTKLYGLLKGYKHPLFNKGHTEQARLKIKQNHCDSSGKNNSHAKKWQLINPDGVIFLCHGNLKEFCINNKLSLSMLKNNRNKGIIKDVTKKTDLTLNTLNWTINEL